MSGNEKREPLIQVQNLGKSFGKIDVLKDITVDIYKGEQCNYNFKNSCSRNRRRSWRVGCRKPSGRIWKRQSRC